jgi:hypothetical protein
MVPKEQRMSNFRTSLLATATAIALLSAPLAFAQSTDANAQQQTDASATADTAGAAVGTDTQADTAGTVGTDVATGTATDATAQSDTGVATGTDTAAQATASTNAAGKMSWSDIDTDKDGNISKSEAVAMPALDRVFVDADGDANGSLTADEYRSYAERASAEGTADADAGTEAGVNADADASVDANADANADAGKDDEKK